MDTIDVTDKPKVTGLELHQLIWDRVQRTQKYLTTPLPHKLYVTKAQFDTINGGDPRTKNRKYFTPKDHTGTPTSCMEVTVLE